MKVQNFFKFNLIEDLPTSQETPQSSSLNLSRLSTPAADTRYEEESYYSPIKRYTLHQFGVSLSVNYSLLPIVVEETENPYKDMFC